MVDTNRAYMFITVGSSLGHDLLAIREALSTGLFPLSQTKFLALDTNRNIARLADGNSGIDVLMLGPTTRQGKGAAMLKPNGMAAFEESREEFIAKVKEDSLEGVIVEMAPGRGGTGSGAGPRVCFALQDERIPFVTVVYKPSRYGNQVALPQLNQYLEARKELIVRGVTFFELDEDWCYAQKLADLDDDEARELLRQEVVKFVVKIATFWNGDGFNDLSDLEEQALSGAGNMKIADAEVNLSGENAESNLAAAFQSCVNHGLCRLEGSMKFVNVFRSGKWPGKYNTLLGHLISSYCRDFDRGDAAKFDATEAVKQFRSYPEMSSEEDSPSGNYFFKDVLLRPALEQPVTSENCHFALFFATRIESEHSDQVHDAQHVGTFVHPPQSTTHTVPAFQSVQLPPAISPVPAVSNSGFVMRQTTAPVARSATTPLSILGSQSTVSKPRPVKLTSDEMQAAVEMHREVYSGTDKPFTIGLPGLFISAVDRANRLANTIIKEWEPIRFVKLSNHIRVGIDPEAVYAGPSSQEVVRALENSRGIKELQHLLDENYKSVAQCFSQPPTEQELGRTWLHWLAGILRQNPMDFPVLRFVSSSGMKVTLKRDMSLEDLVSHERSKQVEHRDAMVIRRVLLLKQFFPNDFDSFWKPPLENGQGSLLNKMTTIGSYRPKWMGGTSNPAGL